MSGSDPSERLESALAGMVTGAMVAILGSALPGGLIIWTIAERGLSFSSEGSVRDAVFCLTGLAVGVSAISAGLRLVWRNVRALRGGDGAPEPGSVFDPE